jgi:hypothetical protein
MAETSDQDVALRLAKARQWIAHQGTGYIPPWDGLTPVEQEQAETEARHWLRAAYNTGVLAPRPSGPAPGLTDEMIEAAARALYGEVAPHGDPEWDDARVRDQDVFRQHATVALTAVLGAGRTVVDLPEPDGHDEIAGIWWWDTFKGRVESRTGNYDQAREADYRAMAVAMLAAAEHNKRLRLAAEQRASVDNNPPTT